MTKVLISCGELSGDEYGACLAKTLLMRFPNIKLRAMGGQSLAAAGAELVIDSEKSASVMGLTELFGSFGKVFRSLSLMKKTLKEWRPNLLIVIDYPEFNMRLAKFAHKLDIPVIYYIPPKVWAWRANRVKQLTRDTNKVVAIFPFEERFLHERGCRQAKYLGNPLLERYKTWKESWPGREVFLKEIGLSPNKPVLSIFPGSRKGEIERHLDSIIASLKLFSSRNPQFQMVINVARSIDTESLSLKIPKDLQIKLVKCDSFSILTASDIGLLKSGTSNLQAAVAGLPFVMFFKVSSSSAFIIKLLVKLSHFSLVNILRPNTIKELTQESANPENIALHIEELWRDEKARNNMKEAFKEISLGLKTRGTQSIPDQICDMANEYIAQEYITKKHIARNAD